jgi:hypothetical protein
MRSVPASACVTAATSFGLTAMIAPSAGVG